MTSTNYTTLRWAGAAQNDFAARMRWTLTPSYRAGNHAPRVGIAPARHGTKVRPGRDAAPARLRLGPGPRRASASRGGSTARRARTRARSSSVRRAAGSTTVTVPADAEPGQTISLILQVHRRRDVPAHPVRPGDPQGRLKQRRARGLGPGLPDRENPHDALRGSRAGGEAPLGERRHAEGRAVAGEDGVHRRLQGPRHRAAPRAQAERRRRRPGRSGPATAASSAPCSSTRSTPTATGSESSAGTTSSHGQFGENFTVEGLGDDEVCIGDRYRIGTAVFEVTQPRVTCYRVGIRMDDPRIPALLVSHRRPGFYFRVLEEGEVEAGDEIVKLASGPEQMTVAEVDALLYLPGHPRQQLLRALRIPALSPGWQASFHGAARGRARRRQRGPGRDEPAAGLGRVPPADGHRDRARERLVISIRLEDPDGEPLPAARPGQYLTLRIQPDDQERSVLRNYSLSGPPGAGYYRITVKRERAGRRQRLPAHPARRRRPARGRARRAAPSSSPRPTRPYC